MTDPTPRENPRLLGHAEAERHLLDAWTSGKLAHGWLITGPKGVGKMTLACRFARFLFAHPDPPSSKGENALFDMEPPSRPETLEIPEDHPVFARVASKGHPDFHVVERRFLDKNADRNDADRKRQSVIAVDDIRAAGRSMSLTAAEGGWRIVIVDGADQMNLNAANALLKLLEEPPARSILLLVAHARGKLPPTIASRCCELRLSPLPPETLAELMRTYRPEIAEDAQERLTGLADGSIGRALGLADGEGLEVHDGLMALLGSLPELDVSAAHEFSRRFGRGEGERAWRTATDLLTRCLNRMVSAGARRSGLDTMGFGREDAERLAALRDKASLDRWLDVWEKTTDLFARTEALHLDRKQVMLNVLGDLQAATRPDSGS